MDEPCSALDTAATLAIEELMLTLRRPLHDSDCDADAQTRTLAVTLFHQSGLPLE